MNKMMEDLAKLGEEVKMKTLVEQERYENAMNALNSVSKKDMNRLIAEQASSTEVSSIMYCVMILTGRPADLQSVNEAVTSLGLMHSVENLD